MNGREWNAFFGSGLVDDYLKYISAKNAADMIPYADDDPEDDEEFPRENNNGFMG